MKLTIGPFIFNFSAEYRSANLRKAILEELAAHPNGIVYAVKRARDIDRNLTLKAAVELVKAIRGDQEPEHEYPSLRP